MLNTSTVTLHHEFLIAVEHIKWILLHFLLSFSSAFLVIENYKHHTSLKCTFSMVDEWTELQENGEDGSAIVLGSLKGMIWENMLLVLVWWSLVYAKFDL